MLIYILAYYTLYLMHIIYLNLATDHQYVTEDHIVYFCKVYYEKISDLEWSVKLYIVRHLKALEEVHSLT